METKVVSSFSFVAESEYAVYFKHTEKNIAMVKFKEDKIINLERAKKIVEQMESIMDTRTNCYSVVEAKIGSGISNRARAYFAAVDQFKTYKKGIAVVIKELPQRIIFNFYIKFNKPYVQHKSFDSIDKALSWLISIGA